MPGDTGPGATRNHKLVRLAGQLDRRDVRQRPPGNAGVRKALSGPSGARSTPPTPQAGAVQPGTGAAGATHEIQEGVLAGQLAGLPRETTESGGEAFAVSWPPRSLASPRMTTRAVPGSECSRDRARCARAVALVEPPPLGVLTTRGVLAVRCEPAITAGVGPRVVLVRLLALKAVLRLGAPAVRECVASVRVTAGLRGPGVSTGRAASGASSRGRGLRVGGGGGGGGGGALRRGRRGLAVRRRRRVA